MSPIRRRRKITGESETTPDASAAAASVEPRQPDVRAAAGGHSPPAPPPRIVLLGPQTRVRSTPPAPAEGPPGPSHETATAGSSTAGALAAVLRDLETEGVSEPGAPLLTVTAGWQEQEGDVVRLGDTGRRILDLALYARAERVVEAAPDLAREHRAVQERLKLLRRAYNRRLESLMTASRRLEGMRGDHDILDAERADALDDIRRLDARHLDRVGELRAEYEAAVRPGERDVVIAEREEIARLLADGDTLVVAGGHVATLINRLRWFGVGELVGSHTVIAWSAGAMALGSRIVLFHDRPPWGPGNAEAFENGIGLFQGVLPFPHATERLALDDPARTGRLARRFAPEACVLLDPGSRIDRVAGGWRSPKGLKSLDSSGRPVDFGARAA